MPVTKTKRYLPSVIKRMRNKRARNTMFGATKTLKQVVKKEILRMAEVKNANHSASFAVLNYAAAGWAASNLKALSPYPAFTSITQGGGEGDRIGNQIRIKKQNVKLIFTPRVYAALTHIYPQPVEIVIWVFGVKNSDVIPANLTGFFMDGNSSSTPTGLLPDLLQDVNKDVYVLYKKIVRKLGNAAYNGTAPVPDQQNWTNNDFKLNQMVTIDTTKYLPTTVSWNDTSTIPYTKGVWIAVECINASGLAMGAAEIPVDAWIEVNTYFTDI